MERIPAVIIGLGRIASLLEDDPRREKPCTHAGAISANPDCILAGGCDINEERRNLFAEGRGVPVYADAAEMIRIHSPKIAVIATHPDSHYYFCRLAAEQGVQVIIWEKPLADTVSAARKIACLAKPHDLNRHARSGPVIITNHERRYSADYIKAKEILSSEKLGTLLSVRSVLYMGMNSRLLDVLWHDGTHLADAIMFLTGLNLKHRKKWGTELTKAYGTAWLLGELKKPGTVSGAASGTIPVIMEIGAGRDHIVFEIEFTCTKGRLRIGNGVFEIWESDESPYAEKFRSLKPAGGITNRIFEGPTGYFANMIADAVSCVRENGRQPVSTARDGLAVIEYLNSVKAWRR